MFMDEASGAVRIFRQTRSTGTETPLPREPYSTYHNRPFIVIQNAAKKMKRTRELMIVLRRWKVDGLADAQFFWVESRIGGEQGGQADFVVAGDGGKGFACRNRMRARFGGGGRGRGGS